MVSVTTTEAPESSVAVSVIGYTPGCLNSTVALEALDFAPPPRSQDMDMILPSESEHEEISWYLLPPNAFFIMLHVGGIFALMVTGKVLLTVLPSFVAISSCTVYDPAAGNVYDK